MSEIRLAFCPFGDKHELTANEPQSGEDFFFPAHVECLTCGATGPLEGTVEMAIKAWNTRILPKGPEKRIWTPGAP